MAVMREGLLSGYITLPKGCEAKGLEQRVTMELLPEALQPAAKAFMKAQPPAFERAIPLLRRLGSLQEGREDVEVFQLLGSALNGTKDFQAGKEVFERTLRMPSFPSASPEQRALVLYNLGCAESALSVNEPGLAAQAVEHIRQSLSLKGTTIKKEDAAADGDLAPLRSNPDFQKMLGLRKGPR